MGLFWAMNPADGDPDQQFYLPARAGGIPVEKVAVTVTEGDKTLATGETIRRWQVAGATDKVYTAAEDRVTGVMVRPKPDGRRHPAVIVLGGSEGGVSEIPTAMLLASHGYTAFAVGYFHLPGLPQTIDRLPLDYFATAARILAAQPGVDPGHVVIAGVSRGAEAALLTAQYFPDVVHGAVLWAPTYTVGTGFPDPTARPWTLHGRVLTDEQIPVDRISGPVLAVGGGLDILWPSATSARLIGNALDAAHSRYPHKVLTFPSAGHLVGTYPYSPQGTQVPFPVTDRIVATGGSRPANAEAQAKSWVAVLALLESLG